MVDSRTRGPIPRPEVPVVPAMVPAPAVSTSIEPAVAVTPAPALMPAAPVAPAPIVAAPVAASVPVAAPKVAVAAPAAAAPPAIPVAGQKTMRSLEEVRADLARLRESARERHAQLQVRQREASFAPTDFMEPKVLEAPHEPEPAPKPRPEASPDNFAPTAFLDFGNVKRPGR